MASQVLIIESDEESLERFGAAFREVGCTVVSARDGETALAEVKSHTPGLILLSAELRGVRSGYTVCKTLKRDPATASIPVFIMSATATPQIFDEHRRLPTRADEYFTKPVDLGALIAAAGRYLEMLGSASPARSPRPSSDAGFENFEADLDAMLSNAGFDSFDDLELEEVDASGFDEFDQDASVELSEASDPAPTVVPAVYDRRRAKATDDHATFGTHVVDEDAGTSPPPSVDSAPSAVDESDTHTPLVETPQPAGTTTRASASLPAAGPARSEKLLRDRLNEADAELIRLKDEHYRAQKLQNEAVARATSAESDVGALRVRAGAAEAELVAVGAQVAGLAEAARQGAAAAAEVARLTTELEETRTAMITADAKRDEAEARAASVTSDLASSRAEGSSRRIEFEAIRAALSSTTAELDAVRGIVNEQREQLRDAESEISGMRDELANAIGQTTQQSEALSASNSELTAARAESASKDGVIAQAEQALAEVQARLGEGVASIDALTASLDESTSELATLRTELRTTRATLDSALAQGVHAADELNAKSAQLDAIRAEFDGSNAEVAAARAELEAVRSDLEERNDELERTVALSAANEARVANLGAEQAASQQVIAQQQSLLGEQQGELAALEARGTELTAQLSAIETALAASTETTASRDLRIAELEESLAARVQRIEELVNSQSVLVTQLNDAREALDTVSRELGTSDNRARQLQDERARIEASNRKLSEELAAVRAATEAENQALTEANRRARTHYESRVQQLVDKVSAADLLIVALRNDRDALYRHAEGLAEVVQSRQQYFEHVAGEVARVSRLFSTVDPLPPLSPPAGESDSVAAVYRDIAVENAPDTSGGYRAAPPLAAAGDVPSPDRAEELTGNHAAIAVGTEPSAESLVETLVDDDFADDDFSGEIKLDGLALDDSDPGSNSP